VVLSKWVLEAKSSPPDGVFELRPDEDSGEKISEAARHWFFGRRGEPPLPFVQFFKDVSAKEKGGVSEFLVSDDGIVFQLVDKVVELARGWLLNGDQVGLFLAKEFHDRIAALAPGRDPRRSGEFDQDVVGDNFQFDFIGTGSWNRRHCQNV
jgi:hypothetical protein